MVGYGRNKLAQFRHGFCRFEKRRHGKPCLLIVAVPIPAGTAQACSGLPPCASLGMVQKRGLAPSPVAIRPQEMDAGEVPVPISEPCPSLFRPAYLTLWPVTTCEYRQDSLFRWQSTPTSRLSLPPPRKSPEISQLLFTASEQVGRIRPSLKAVSGLPRGSHGPGAGRGETRRSRKTHRQSKER